jgi:hypothetical protein
MPGDDAGMEVEEPTTTSVDVHTGTEPPARSRKVRRTRRPGNLKKSAPTCTNTGAWQVKLALSQGGPVNGSS